MGNKPKTARMSSVSDPSTLRVAGYVRVSTDKQKASGLGLKDQRLKIASMCSLKDWPEPELYVDEGLSGSKETTARPALRQLIEDVRAGKVDVVVINSLDRLARKARLTLELADLFKAEGVALISCKETLDTTTPAGQLFLTVLAAMAEFERDLARERTKAALDELVRGGLDRGGRLPYGYLRTVEGLEVDADTAPVVCEIFSMRYELLYSLRAIASALNARQVPTARDGIQWYPSTVREILLNESAYRGGGSRGQEQLAWPIILAA